MDECVLHDLGSALSEYEVEFRIAFPPVIYKRKYVKMYSHKENGEIKLIIPATNLVLKHKAS